MKPLSERDENPASARALRNKSNIVGMKPLSERDENLVNSLFQALKQGFVGMKPLSERDENLFLKCSLTVVVPLGRNEATL